MVEFCVHGIAAVRFTQRSNRAHHHRQRGTLGNGRSRKSSHPLRELSPRGRPDPRHARLSRGKLHGTHRRWLDVGAKDPSSSPPAYGFPGERSAAGWPKAFGGSEVTERLHHLEPGASKIPRLNCQNEIASRRSRPMARRQADQSSPRHRCPALASFPPTGPALRMHDAERRQQSRNPGLPPRLAPGLVHNGGSGWGGYEKPLRSTRLGRGPITDAAVRSERTASMSRASIGKWPRAIQRCQFDRISAFHRLAHLLRTPVREGRCMYSSLVLASSTKKFCLRVGPTSRGVRRAGGEPPRLRRLPLTSWCRRLPEPEGC